VVGQFCRIANFFYSVLPPPTKPNTPTKPPPPHPCLPSLPGSIFEVVPCASFCGQANSPLLFQDRAFRYSVSTTLPIFFIFAPDNRSHDLSAMCTQRVDFFSLEYSPPPHSFFCSSPFGSSPGARPRPLPVAMRVSQGLGMHQFFPSSLSPPLRASSPPPILVIAGVV